MVGSRIVKASELLRANEAEVPAAVLRAEENLANRGIWYRLARNSTAMSCRDAANRRERLGQVGIPLHDELKTIAYRNPAGGLVFGHARGDESIDEVLLAAAAGAESLVYLDDDFSESIGLGYGLFNPFESWTAKWDQVLVTHVFDPGLQRHLGTPGTMMTNAGDRTWAVEFDPIDLVRSTDGAIVAPIVESQVRRKMAPSKIGILTGNAPESGIRLWEKVLASVRERLGRQNRGDLSMPPVEVLSVPEMGLSMELDVRLEAVREVVLGSVRTLAANGCTLIAIACNTTQFFSAECKEIAAEYGARFIPLADTVAKSLTARGVRKVALVGIPYVSDLGDLSAYAAPFGVFEVETPSAVGMERITEIAYTVKGEGPTQHALNRLNSVLKFEFTSHDIVLALTELSLLLDIPQKRRPDAQVLHDPLTIYADELARLHLAASAD